MKKELIFAVVIGLVVGLAITYGVYRVRTNTPKQTANKTGTTDSATNSATTDSSTLALSSPEDESVQTSAALTVAGTTIPDSFVVIFVNDKETVTTADQSGNFSIATQLISGSNIIRVHSVQEDGTTTQTERTVIYLTDDFAAAKESTASAKPSPSPSPTAKPTTKPTTTAKPSPSPTAQPR